MAYILFLKEVKPRHFEEVFSFRTTKDFIWFYNLDHSDFGFFEDDRNRNIDSLINWICYSYTFQSSQMSPISKDIKLRTFNLLNLLYGKDKQLFVSVWD